MIIPWHNKRGIAAAVLQKINKGSDLFGFSAWDYLLYRQLRVEFIVLYLLA